MAAWLVLSGISIVYIASAYPSCIGETKSGPSASRKCPQLFGCIFELGILEIEGDSEALQHDGRFAQLSLFIGNFCAHDSLY